MLALMFYIAALTSIEPTAWTLDASTQNAIKTLPAPRTLSASESAHAYAMACFAFELTGNADYIAVRRGNSDADGMTEVDCADFEPEMNAEREFRHWYTNTAQRLHLDANPDDPRHCYDYRAFFRAMVAGKAWLSSGGKRFPKAFETACHKPE